ncbi:MAG: hypothetical protein H0W73_07085 [Bacteroidetes bacterium]|nr:hypothetical protein [Bacteroidota bacterium]
MVEVFKTNVNEPYHAEIILRFIHKSFLQYNASFDLEDHDKILRVQSGGNIETERLMNFILELGFQIEILPDEIPSQFLSNSSFPDLA